MKVKKKVDRSYNLRSVGYENSMKNKNQYDIKVQQRCESGGYRRPGSYNPRKARNG